MHQDQELELIEKVRSGDRSAYRELYKKYKNKIFNYLYRMVKNRDMAEELTQQTFINVYVNIHKYKPTGSFSSWVYATARNAAKNEFRRIRRTRSVSTEKKLTENGNITLGDMLESDVTSAEKLLEKEDLRNRIAGVLEELPPHYREVLVLCWMRGLSYAEAGKIIGCSRDVVSKRLGRAKKEFMRLLKKAEKE